MAVSGPDPRSGRSAAAAARYARAPADLLVLLLISALLLGGQTARLGTRADRNQWDFRAHFFATRAWLAGENPYDVAATNRLNTTAYPIPREHAYPHHPFGLGVGLLFGPDFDRASRLRYWLDVGLLLLLLCAWKLLLLPEAAQLLLLPLTAFFAFDQSALLALAAGGPALLEAAGIWLALLCFVRGRSLGFLAPLLALAFFDTTSILLTPLVLLLPEPRRQARILLWALSATGLLWLSPLLLDPPLFWAWWSRPPGAGASASSLALIADSLRQLGVASASTALLAWAAWIALGLFAWGRAVRDLDLVRDRVALALLSLTTWTLLAPRLGEGGFVALVPVAAWLLARRPALLAFVFFGVFFQGVQLPWPLVHHAALLAVLVCGVALLQLLRERIRTPAPPRA